MGKSKSKKSQPKRYPTPTDKYLIVTDPWGGVPEHEPDFFNNVTAWFEIMFKPKYPGIRPSAIFYQWTNKNIIVEIPDHINVEPYLGAHYWATFLVPPHCDNVGSRASYIYEFETRFFPIPAAQGGWKPGYARYTKIRPNFDVREPYPEPLPAPNSPLPFARKLPPSMVAVAGQALPLPLPLPNLVSGSVSDGVENCEATGSQSSKSGGNNSDRANGIGDKDEHQGATRGCGVTADTQISDPRQRDSTATPDTAGFQQYQPPGHLAEAEARLVDNIPHSKSRSMPPPPLLPQTKPKLAKKMDPYEEEEVAMAFLRRSVTAPASPIREASVKSEIEVKQELIPPDQDKDYTPSLELQDAFRSLQQHPEGHSDDLPNFIDDEEREIKPRVKIEEDEGYEPSAEWAQAFPSFDPSTLNSASEEYEPSECLLAALAELPEGMVDMTATPMPSGDEVRVKPEPCDDAPFAALRERERSTTLVSEPPETPGRVRIKREFSEEYVSTKRVKLLH